MNIQELSNTISNLKKIKDNASGETKLELIDTVYDLELKLNEMVTAGMDIIDIQITNEDLSKIDNATESIQAGIDDAEVKANMINTCLTIGKKIISLL